MASKYKLHDRALFQTSGRTLKWNSDHWDCDFLIKAKGFPERNIIITADYVILASGTFTYPKLPNFPGLENFKGKMIHTARWDYGLTGGTPSLHDSELTGLKGKRVGIVGTGATAIQVVPAVARHAGELYVFQRTPSAVEKRDNRETDLVEWNTKIANTKGWQYSRGDNFQAFSENTQNGPDVNLVDDGWTHMPTISAAYGGNVTYKMGEMEKFIEDMQKQDAPRSDRVRQRAEEVVKDPETAKVRAINPFA